MIYCYNGIHFNRVYIQADSLLDAMSNIHDYFQYDIEHNNMESPFTNRLYCINRDVWNECSDNHNTSELEEFGEELADFISSWYDSSNWQEHGVVVLDHHY